jgi:hypothetical protein
LEIPPVATIEETAVDWIIVDSAGEVLVMCAGADADAFAAEYVERGYLAVRMEPRQ